MAWTRRIYFCLFLIRLYFALSPSYIHPDEHFQGPEVIAGELFGWNTTKTWEFTSKSPIRSYFPLWIIYAPPMIVLKWISGDENPSTGWIFYALRAIFLFFSIAYEDLAIQELISSTVPDVGLLLTASSWVTWTIQTRTFSNSVETVILLWTLVLIQRIVNAKRSSSRDCILLAACVVFGTFNRITFPTFLVIPGLSVLRHFAGYPLSFLYFTIPALLFTISAIVIDTNFYTSIPILSIRPKDLIITPINNLIYNSDTSNLAQHGLHPQYTHLLINLPQLIGPALIPLFFTITNLQTLISSIPIQSAISGISLLSIFKHQELRFLIPIVPLILSSINLPFNTPSNLKIKRIWISVWLIFNLIFGVLMGVYHQGGIVPVQLYISELKNVGEVVYWKTYKPPKWLLGDQSKNIEIVDLMGGSFDKVTKTIQQVHKCDGKKRLLVAPLSAMKLDPYISKENYTIVTGEIYNGGKGEDLEYRLSLLYRYTRHLHLDDMDFGDDGVLPTINRVIGRRGIGVYRIDRVGCDDGGVTSQIKEMVKEKFEGMVRGEEDDGVKDEL